MAVQRLYQFPSKSTLVSTDIVYIGDSADAFNEVNTTVAGLIGAYPSLFGIGGLTLGNNSYPYVNNSGIYTAGTISALGVSLLANSTVSTMQSTLGYTATPAASLFSGWDANKNLSANNFNSAYTTTPTAAGSTTLTVSSTFQQFFTGSTTQTVLLPVTSTLALGQSFYIVNNSSGIVTVQSSGGNTIQAMAANTTLLVTCILLTGTGTASWYADYNYQTALSIPVPIASGGTGVSSVTITPTASAWAGWDANKNLSANSAIQGYTTTVTAAGTTTLTVGSTFQQFFTGSTTQIVVMPVTSTLALGQSWYLVNNSSGNVTVESSGGNTIIVMSPSTTAWVTCILTSGTTAASWYADYVQSGLTLPVTVPNGGSGFSSTTAYGLIAGGTTSTGALQNAGTGTSGQIYVSGGSSSLGSWTSAPTFASIAFSSTTGIIGTTTNSNAAAGSVGEYVFSAVAIGSAVSLSTNVAANVTSVSVSGDWDIWGTVGFSTGGTTTVSNVIGAVSTTSATLPTADQGGISSVYLPSALTGLSPILSTGAIRVSSTSPTTVYLVASSGFSVSTQGAYGIILGRRRR